MTDHAKPNMPLAHEASESLSGPMAEDNATARSPLSDGVSMASVQASSGESAPPPTETQRAGSSETTGATVQAVQDISHKHPPESEAPVPELASPKPLRHPQPNLSLDSDLNSEIRVSTQSPDLPPSLLTAPRSSSTAPPEQALVTVESRDRAPALPFGRPTSAFGVGSNASHSTSSSPLSRSADTSAFPNQAYSALQGQYHPSAHPHFMKMRPSSSKSYAGQSSLSDTPQRQPEDPRFPAEAGSKTTSATSSPGLFTPTTSPLRPGFSDLDGTPSPSLHYTHRQPPKETQVADIDVDPVSGRKIINHYEIIDEIGRGTHGKVKLGRDLNTNEQVAIKIIDRVSKRKRLGKTNNQDAKIKREIAILKKARHDNIVGLLEVIDDPAKKKVYIVLELAELGEVQWRVRGEREICLVEYRRCKRESEGIFENDAAVQEDQHILDTAHRHLERVRRREWEQAERNQGPWSLEFGGASGSEGRNSTRPPTPSSRSVASERPSHVSSHNSDAFLQGLDTPIEDSNEETPQPTHEQFDFSHGRSYLTDEYHTALEGTMYGAYDSSSDRARSPSALDSFASSHDDHQPSDYIPEHFQWVPVMTFAEARRTIRDTLLGLEFLHYQGVIHRDIKPANLLETKNHRIKISDFGVSYLGQAKKDGVNPDALPDESEVEHEKVDEAAELAKTVGTPAFYAPELCRTDALDDFDDAPPVTGQIDVWALGVTLYCLIFGRVPFHDNNQWVLMRHIAEQDVYIPSKRLKAAEENPGHNDNGHTLNSNKRLSHDLEYEEVPQDLKDLLRKLLTKDPRQRIQLGEVKHHPWLLSGIQDPTKWIVDTSASKITQGKKIEISKEDVDVAVMPLSVVDRVRDTLRKIVNPIIGRSASKSRRRARSNAGTDTLPSSNASSSSTISQDAKRQESRRPSLKPDEALFSALKASREGEHPLSQSVTASPEIKERTQFFSTEAAPLEPLARSDGQADSLSGRPDGPERAHSSISTTGSIRTIRPSDIDSLAPPGPATLPALPSTPLDGAPSALSGIFGGAKRLIKRPKSRDLVFTKELDPSVDRTMGDVNPHSEPSIAISNAIAAGVVNPPPALLDEHQASNSTASAPSSRTPSLTAMPDIGRAKLGSISGDSISRQSSLSSVASHQYQQHPEHPISATIRHTWLPLVGDAPHERSVSRQSAKSDQQIVERAKEEQFRRLIQEGLNKQEAERAHSANQAATVSQLSSAFCPPSPDDLAQASPPAVAYKPETKFSPLGPPAVDSDVHPQMPKHLPANSSEEHFPSGISQSTSNPSIPSVISGHSSVTTDDTPVSATDYKKQTSLSSDDPTVVVNRATIAELIIPSEEDDGYAGDHAIESEDSSDDEPFLEIRRKRPAPAANPGRSNSISNVNFTRETRRASAISSIRTARSGSNNTMQKVRSHSPSDDATPRPQTAHAT